MKKIKTHIKTSPSKDLLFDVYREEDPLLLPATTDALVALVPIMEVEESKITSKAHLITEESVIMDVGSVITGDFLPYAVKHGMLRDILHTVFVRIDLNTGSTKTYTISFDSAQTIVKVVDEALSEYSAFDTFQINSSTVIRIKQSLLTNAINVKVTYYTEVIEVVDIDDPQEGVTYTGPTPLGFPKADILKRNKTLTLTTAATAPYYEFEAHMIPGGQTYYYRVLGKDLLGNISDPSDIMSVTLQQADAEVEYMLQACLDDSATPEVWTDTGDKFINGQVKSFGKIDTTAYATQGTIFVEKKPMDVPIASFTASLRTVPTAAITLGFANAWKGTTFKTKKTKAFRLKGYMKSHPSINDISDTITHENFSVGIDKVIVRRKVVTDPTITDPCTLSGTDASTAATFLKKDGVSYSAVMTTTPGDIDLTTVDSATFQTGMKYSIMTDASGLTNLTLIDLNVVAGEIYRYTVFIKDDLGIWSVGSSYDVHN